MKANAQKEQPVRLTNEELRKSRAGKLGCFPSEDLYEPEQEDTKARKAPGLKGNESWDSKSKKPRE